MERPIDDHPHAAAGALRFFSNRRSAAAETAWRCAHRVLDHRELRSLGHWAANAAAGPARADRRAAASRRAALELARIRHASRRLALLRALRAARNQANTRHQRAHLRGLCPCRRGGQASALGVHGPRLRPNADSQDRRSGSDDQPLNGHPGALHWQTPGGLAGAWPHPDAGNPGAPRQCRREIHRRLGL